MTLLSDCISVQDFTVEKSLEQSGSDLLIVSCFWTELYLFMKVDGVRTIQGDRYCQNSINCLKLELRALFHAVCVKSGAINPKTIKFHNCSHLHNEVDLICAYSQAERMLDHPFMTRSICQLIVSNLHRCLDEHVSEKMIQMPITDDEEGDRLMNIPLFAKKETVGGRIRSRSESPEPSTSSSE